MFNIKDSLVANSVGLDQTASRSSLIRNYAVYSEIFVSVLIFSRSIKVLLLTDRSKAGLIWQLRKSNLYSISSSFV